MPKYKKVLRQRLRSAARMNQVRWGLKGVNCSNKNPNTSISEQSQQNNDDKAMSTTASPEKAKNMAELDKFKRRMIRTVARLMKEKKSQSDIWTELKKESGCDCKLLWQRMRILTLKKLKRLLLADDRSESIPEIARMSLTDWLLFDLVLVHEKVDVIGRDGVSIKESEAMRNVFELVHNFDIMACHGEYLVDAWARATVYYNSMGHQCSPMLLQRRWYQLMEYTRELFYKFWFNYRGNAKLLVNAEPYTPNQLQMDIAKRYPELITQPFLDWESRIQNKSIIMPEEFQIQFRTRIMKTPIADDNVPDIEVVEPVIETIDLGQDSDDEQTRKDKASSSETNVFETKPFNAVTIKDEPKDANDSDGSDMSDIEILETTRIPQEKPTNDEFIALENDDLQDELKRLQTEEDNVLNTSTITEKDFEAEASKERSEETTVSESVELHPPSEIIMPHITNVFGNVNESNETLTKISTLSQKPTIFDKTATNIIRGAENMTVKVETDIPNIINRIQNYMYNDLDPITINDEDNISGFPQSDTSSERNLSVDDVVNIEDIEEKADSHNNCPEPEMVQEADVKIPKVTSKIHTQTNNASDSNKDVVKDVHTENISNNDSLIARDNIYMETCKKSNVEIANPSKNISGSTVIDKDIEMMPEITTKIENYSSEDDEIANINFGKSLATYTEAPPESGNENRDCINFFDGAHHMDINFADDGIELVDDGIEYVEDVTEVESKLATSQIRNESGDGEDETNGNPIFDLKLIMDPVVYTVKLDHMPVFKDRSYHYVNDKILIDNISIESKPVSKKSVKDIEIDNLNYSNASDDKRVSDDLFKHPSCDESEKEEIEQIKKVKLSSKILHKPKSRSYNPIQLCKNPDFNTRLKRLPIGFYSSSRNLLLLKACKPMTIDVSKAFESKLINGVMHLTASDSVIPVKDDNEENKLASTILPSAMPVQSLIDITKVSDLIEISKERSETAMENLSDNDTISVRSKGINLPDISEIRHINQQLITVEVPPIKTRNNYNICKINEVANADELNTIYDSHVTSDICHDNLNMKSKNKSNNTVHDEKLRNIESKNKTIPLITRPKVTASFESDSSRKIEANQSKTKNTATNLNNSTKSDINKKNTSLNYVAPWKSRFTTPVASWLAVPKYLDNYKIEDSLLTMDTLNKMLNLLDGKEDLTHSKKKKKKKKAIAKESNKTVTQQILPTSNLSAKTDKRLESNIENLKGTNTVKKLKINILIARNGPEYKGVHCCWAKEKMFCRQYKSKRLSRHNCWPLECVCCCKDKLNQISQTSSGSTDEHNDLMIQKACESIESVVQQTREMSVMKNFVTKVDDPHQLVDTFPQTGEMTIMRNFVNKISNTSSVQDNCVGADLKQTTIIANIDPVTEATTTIGELGEAIEANSSIDSAEIDKQTLNPHPILVSNLNSDTAASMAISTNVLSVEVSEPDNTTLNQQPILVSTLNSDTTVSMTASINTLSTEVSAHNSLNRYPILTSTLNADTTASMTTSLNTISTGVSIHENEAENRHPILVSSLNSDTTASMKISINTLSTEDSVNDNNTLNSQPIYVSALNSVTSKCMTNSINTLTTGVTSHDHALVSPRSLLKTVNIPIEQKSSSQTLKQNINVNTKKKIACAVCTCTSPKVSLDSPQRRIVIDGSKNCLMHSDSSPKKQVSDKILYLSSNQILKSPTDSPIYIGKNKILLTNIKLPRNEDVLSQSRLPIQPGVIPTIPLPNGVQILLSTNGEVSYTIVPGVDLAAEQLTSLPGILAEVQQQVNCTAMPFKSDSLPSSTITSDEVINLSDDDNTEKLVKLDDEKPTANPDIIQGTQIPVEHSKIPTENASINEISNNNQVESNNIISSITSSTVSNSSTILKDDVIRNIVEAQDCENESIQNSDMCDKERDCNDSTAEKINVGLETPAQDKEEIENLHKIETFKSAETTTLEKISLNEDQLDNKQENNNLDWNSEFIKSINCSKNAALNPSNDMSENIKKNCVLEKADTDISANRKSLLSDLMEMSGISTEDTAISQENISEEPDKNAVPYLKPISLNQSSYSQSQIELSSITSFAELKYASARNGLFFKLDFETGVIVPINVCIKKKKKTDVDKSISIAPKAVVDLTEYHDISVSQSETVSSGNKQSCIVRSKIPNILLKRKKLHNDNIVKPVKLFKATHRSAQKRNSQSDVQNKANKQLNKNKIETTINLIDSDSDNPMEEEYLLNSSDCDDVVPQSFTSNDDDSSDDEPLAKKAKRIRVHVDISNETVSPNGIDQIKVENLHGNMSLNITDVEPMNVDMVSGMDDLVSPNLSFISTHSKSDAEEDCILGV